MRRKPVEVSKQEKIDFIAEHQALFLDEWEEHQMELEVFRRGLESNKHIPSFLGPIGKSLVKKIREKFDYAKQTASYDILTTWRYFYSNSIFFKRSIKLEKPMSKINQQDLIERIKDVFQNKAHEQHFDVLMELFPEIYEEVREKEWDEHFEVGHVYARISTYGHVISLLMPVILPHDEVGKVEIRILNLITGGFWSSFVVTNSDNINNRILSTSDFLCAVGGRDLSGFKHIGSFYHGNSFIALKKVFDGHLEIFHINETK